jgi:prevent-host-death family protein
MSMKEVLMSVSIAEAKGHLSDLIKQAHDEPVVITRRGRPDVVLLSFEDYELLHRVRAYLAILRLSRELHDVPVTATELHESSRRELEERP